MAEPKSAVYLTDDAPIPGKRYAIVSFASPEEDVFIMRERVRFLEFMKSLCIDDSKTHPMKVAAMKRKLQIRQRRLNLRRERRETRHANRGKKPGDKEPLPVSDSEGDGSIHQAKITLEDIADDQTM